MKNEEITARLKSLAAAIIAAAEASLENPMEPCQPITGWTVEDIDGIEDDLEDAFDDGYDPGLTEKQMEKLFLAHRERVGARGQAHIRADHRVPLRVARAVLEALA